MFGRSVAMAGGTALVGSHGGAAYVFWMASGRTARAGAGVSFRSRGGVDAVMKTLVIASGTTGHAFTVLD